MSINSQRLSRYITSRECMSTVDYLINEIIDKLTVEQRLEIKTLLKRNASQSFNYK